LQIASRHRRELDLEEVDQLRLKQVERARYEANLAQRRYMQVEPEHRLVPDTLEAEWNRKLHALAEAWMECERQRSLDRQLLDREKREKIMVLVSDFRVWNDPGTPVREKKRLVAMMIEDVTLTRGTEITMHGPLQRRPYSHSQRADSAECL
jgi:hypothetical protein